MKDHRLIVLPESHVVSPLEGFIHDVDFTRFDDRVGRIVLPVLALAVAVVALTGGLLAAIGAAAAVVVGLVLVIALWERDRWRAQDVLNWFSAARRRRWLEDTGGPGPGGDPAAAEIWLGVHRPGAVPQLYRATAAFQTGDAHRSQLELAAMPEATPGDRALKVWVVERDRWLRTGVADTRELQTLLDELPDSDDTATLRVWIAQVEAADLWRRREPLWLGPLLAEWPDARRYKLSVRARSRLWLSRFIAVPVFVVLSFTLSATGLALGFGRDHVPASYAQSVSVAATGLERGIDRRVRDGQPADPDLGDRRDRLG